MLARAETLLRLVQAVPSPKAEPIKLWLAKLHKSWLIFIKQKWATLAGL